jgi:hypothetical protein
MLRFMVFADTQTRTLILPDLLNMKRLNKDHWGKTVRRGAVSTAMALMTQHFKKKSAVTPSFTEQIAYAEQQFNSTEPNDSTLGALPHNQDWYWPKKRWQLLKEDLEVGSIAHSRPNPICNCTRNCSSALPSYAVKSSMRPLEDGLPLLQRRRFELVLNTNAPNAARPQ